MIPRRYDVVIAGARCAGASTAMLLARAGMHVLVVDPLGRGTDTLSTHAIMRAGVLQLHRWGLLDAVKAAGTPPVRTTTFYYADEKIEVAIKPRDGVDALYAPRRTVLDPILVDAAVAAGADVVHGHSVVGVLRDGGGRVRGVQVAGPDRETVDVEADLVVGADGLRSRVARLLETEVDYALAHKAAVLYGYWTGLGLNGNHWFYRLGCGIGAIPTNHDEACVFVGVPPDVFERERRQGLEGLYHRHIRESHPELAERIAGGENRAGLRAFAGEPGFLRRSAGLGWALVGDAGYFRDPITAHGITDALRDAESLARAVIKGGEQALHAYQKERDALVRELLDTTDRIASFEWDLDEVKQLHLTLSREMNREVDVVLQLDQARV
jgi:2-polyprenyl-6-methoxyphenol hydroxylase-like FAD-dependent oxidoreductase